MAGKALMLLPDDVRERARTRFDRNWRDWARDAFYELMGMEDKAAAEPLLSVNLKPPRESELTMTEARERARAWTSAWHACQLPAKAEWEVRRWPRIGDQQVAVRATVQGAHDIAIWADRSERWELALSRVADAVAMARGLGDYDASEVADAVRSSIGAWCDLSGEDWRRALAVLEWLARHPSEGRYARQLPIHGVDTKWMEAHGACLRPFYGALVGRDFSFKQPRRMYRCKACCPETQLAGLRDFSLDAAGLAQFPVVPQRVILCENLVNTLCLDDLPETLAIHGGGYAVDGLREVPWIAEVDLHYWGDLDTHGFAILSQLRSFAPHAQSVMMDAETLERHLDLCVEEPSPAMGVFARLTDSEQQVLALLREGDAARGIGTLRLEQERVEWTWALQRLRM